MAATVGIVLVSHSAALAAGAAELAGQVGGGAVRVEAAGGTSDGRLGTSADKVVAAVGSAAAGGGGVVVVPDLGSSVLTVRSLLADGDLADFGPVELADAPFVEGAVAAAVVAAAGGSLKDVLDAAQEARHAGKL